MGRSNAARRKLRRKVFGKILDFEKPNFNKLAVLASILVLEQEYLTETCRSEQFQVVQFVRDVAGWAYLDPSCIPPNGGISTRRVNG